MSQETKNVPKWRFPEFEGEWEISELEEPCKYTKGFAFKSEDYTNSGVRIIRVSDLGARKIKLGESEVFIRKEQVSEFSQWKILKDEILLTTVGSRPELVESAVGRAIYIDSENVGLLNQNSLKLRANKGYSNIFTFSQLNSPRYISYIFKIKRGNANQANIIVKELLKFQLSKTTYKEQQKIAICLTSLDRKIELVDKKLTQAQTFKKGLFQQMFV